VTCAWKKVYYVGEFLSRGDEDAVVFFVSRIRTTDRREGVREGLFKKKKGRKRVRTIEVEKEKGRGTQASENGAAVSQWG